MNDQLPQAITPDSGFGISTFGMAPGLAIMFNEKAYKQCTQVATDMSRAEGILPPHLIGKPVSCYAVLMMAITWKLDPFQVARSTYETPGGKVAFEGKLVQSILVQSGKLDGGIKYEMIGEWDRLRGKFRKEKSTKGHEYFVPAWDTNKDEEGLGVRVSAQVKGEVERREEVYWLRSFWPRNSTLWALRPEQQIKYAAARAFANTAMPELLFGVPFTDDGTETMRDITPARPQRRDFTQEEPTVVWDAAGETGEIAPEDAAPAAEEPAPEFGHAEAHQLGIQQRNANRPMSAPPDLASEFHDAFLDGWRSRDDEIAAEKKGRP